MADRTRRRGTVPAHPADADGIVCDERSLLCCEFGLQRSFGLLSGPEQLTLVFMAVSHDQQGEVVELIVAVALTCRVDDHWHDRPAAMDDVELHLGDGALHLQQRSPVCLMEDFAPIVSRSCNRHFSTRSHENHARGDLSADSARHCIDVVVYYRYPMLRGRTRRRGLFPLVDRRRHHLALHGSVQVKR
ncbi:hypothetical protein [Caballeronia humi]|uniref:hypothetical protein n=1 Tax=Caballeronia humi TaxID=326474 RepID=UPI000B3ED801|nr:hypothetical protein [Caballeronia humi]